MAEELWVVMRPVIPADKHQHLDDLVLDEWWVGGVAPQEVVHEEVAELCLL